MQSLELRNQRIIDAVLQKERLLCPGSIALIGIYGSFATGDIHPFSDLDLLILINDERGSILSRAFVQEDLQVAHDIYCTTWDSLREDLEAMHPHIAKWMDAKILYCADETDRKKLYALREQMQSKLSAALTMAEYESAEAVLRDAQMYCIRALTSSELSDVRKWAGATLYFLETALTMLNKTYFRRGVHRAYAELSEMKKRPEALCAQIEDVVCAKTTEQLKKALSDLMRDTLSVFDAEKRMLSPEKHLPEPTALMRTYEEMVSNWRGKLRLAAETGDRHLAFSSLAGFEGMLADLTAQFSLPSFDVFAIYDPGDLAATSARFDALLERYREICESFGTKLFLYPNVDAFAADYLKN